MRKSPLFTKTLFSLLREPTRAPQFFPKTFLGGGQTESFVDCAIQTEPFVDPGLEAADVLIADLRAQLERAATAPPVKSPEPWGRACPSSRRAPPRRRCSVVEVHEGEEGGGGRQPQPAR